jgi:ubiquinone/menaquinone biosynthesis C-methylase UbiE
MSNSPIYDVIGAGYNSTRRADPYIADRLYEFLLQAPNGIYLDLGCGTGNYTVALAEKGLHFYGVEPSERMLIAARERSGQVEWMQGAAEQIPVENNFFHGAIATLTIHHWKDLHTAFAELYRVLKPGARLVIFTASLEQTQGYWLNHYFPEMMENSTLQMPSIERVTGAITGADFTIIGTEKYFIQDDLKDNFLYVGKNRPEVYFEERIRQGISSFSALANVDEVINGLETLRGDLENNRFDTVKAKFENDLGDYLFIIAEKC